MKDCIFCKIVSGDAPSYKIYEDEAHLAFLSIFPNTKGFSVVIPKKHYDSYIFEQDDAVINDLMKACKKVAKLLDSKLADVGRTGIFFEGFGVNHLHAKLFPMHGTKGMKQWTEINSNVDKYFEKYEGYMSSHNSKPADKKELEDLAKKIRE